MATTFKTKVNEIDYYLCEYGINITRVTQLQLSTPSIPPTFAVEFEFMVKYKFGGARWAKDVLITQYSPDSNSFKEILFDYAQSIRQKMATVTLKSE